MEHDADAIGDSCFSRPGEVSVPGQRGFSLIEMLFVIVIVAVLAAIIAPNAISAMSSSRLTSAADEVVGLVDHARQVAIALNRVVEVRFYQFSDGSGANFYQAVQTFQADANGNTSIPLTKVRLLPGGIIIDSGATLSPLLARTKTFTASDPKIALPGVGTAYNCAAFQISPGGSMVLPFQSWYLTLHSKGAGDSLTTPPANFAAVQIDPASGTVKVYRP